MHSAAARKVADPGAASALAIVAPHLRRPPLRPHRGRRRRASRSTWSTATSRAPTCSWPATARSRSATSASPRSPAPRRTAKTEIGEIKGTAAYMAPEHRIGQDVDARADVYAVGAIGYELLTGQEINLDLAMLAHLGREGWPHLPPPSARAPGAAGRARRGGVPRHGLRARRPLRPAARRSSRRSPRSSSATAWAPATRSSPAGSPASWPRCPRPASRTLGEGRVAGMKGRKEAVRPPYADGGFFVLRSPLLPLDTLLRAGARGSSEPATRRRWRATPSGCAPGCGALVDRPEVREAHLRRLAGVDEQPGPLAARPGRRARPEGGAVALRTSRAWRRARRRSACSPAARSAARRRHPRWSSGRSASLPPPHPPRHRLPRCALPGPASPTRRCAPASTVRPNSSLYRAAGALRYAEARLVGKVRSLPPGRGRADHVPGRRPRARRRRRARPASSPPTWSSSIRRSRSRRPSAFIDELIDSQILRPRAGAGGHRPGAARRHDRRSWPRSGRRRGASA